MSFVMSSSIKALVEKKLKVHIELYFYLVHISKHSHNLCISGLC